MSFSGKRQGSFILDQLLKKRICVLTANSESLQISQLVNQLRRSYPEYQRQNKSQFTEHVESVLAKFPNDHHHHNNSDNDSDTTNSSEENTTNPESEAQDEINDAIAEFMKSETINRDLRVLYGSHQTTPTPNDPTTAQQPLITQNQNPQSKKRTSVLDSEPKRSSWKRQRAPDSTGCLGGPSQPRCVKYSDLGGLKGILQDIKELVEYPLKHPEVYEWLGVDPPRGVLLHGPPGCGKTVLAHAIAYECNVPFFKISAPEIVSGMSGESEAKIRTLFTEASQSVPAIIFIDEIDAIAAKREHAQREMERRIVAQLLTSMDDLLPQKTSKVQGHVVVLGATNRPDVLDPALRRAGRFDREIALGIPTESSRNQMLQVMCSKLRLEGEFDFTCIARKTPGFVGADLEALTKEAAANAVTRIFKKLEQKNEGKLMDSETGTCRFGNGCLSPEELRKLAIVMEDFLEALKKVQPSLGREGFTTKPDITWADVGSLTEIREELSFAICKPILHPEKFEGIGLSLASGVLLFGPPGCGKTLVAKAVANEAGTNFISIKGPELLNKYVGESERAVRQLFTRARAAKPCVLFFDEMDALAPKRGLDNNQVAERLVNQLLTEMDGMDCREGVYLIAATNRPDIIDPALLRPGRLDKILYVALPDATGRVSILKTLSRKSPLAQDVKLEEIAFDLRCVGFSGADLAALVKEASVIALKESLKKGNSKDSGIEITRRHFDDALVAVKPSVSELDVAKYEQMRLSLRSTRSHVDSKLD
eukprot:g7873.t1